MTENKPCPLCGSSCFALIVDGQELGSCSNEGCVLWSNMRPVKEWNTRPIEDAQAAEIERLKEELAQNEWGAFWHKQYETMLNHYNILVCQCNDELRENLAPIQIPGKIKTLWIALDNIDKAYPALDEYNQRTGWVKADFLHRLQDIARAAREKREVSNG